MKHRGPGASATIAVDAAGLGVTMALLATFALAVVAPALQGQAAERSEKVRVDAVRAEAKKLRAERLLFDSGFEQASRDLAATRVKVEPVSKLNSRLAGLTEAGSEFGLVIDRILPEPGTNAPKATLVPIRVEGRGGFVPCRDWLAQLRTDYPDIAVRGLDISRDTSTPENATRFAFDLLWYAAPSSQTEPEK
ncbi:MAG: hypothetical protein K2Y21_07590 [Phycisphaerales bacterium]|nr:hypothetical protein [Phycisphaerales bacterium]